MVLTASTHLYVNLPNALTQETVRAYYTGWYKKLVTELPEVTNRHVSPPEGPGWRLSFSQTYASAPTCT
jgi:L-alanine-DL-glutamate epimerase-like enolase superfamily enzyme